MHRGQNQDNYSAINRNQKDPAYEDKLVDWVLSEYKDNSQLLNSQELQNRLIFIEGKVLNNEENLFLVKSTLNVFKTQFKLKPVDEQKISTFLLGFINKAQKEQLHKIKNPHLTAGKVLLWTKGQASLLSMIFKTILSSDSFVRCSYLEKLVGWLASGKKANNKLLSRRELKLALALSHPGLTEMENQFLVRSLVFSLRVS